MVLSRWIASAAGLVVLLPSLHAAETSRPNIILIMADDLGYGDLGCYGSDVHQTPHIDALAESGIRFTDFHAAGPMCSPTRAATLTGLYQQRFGARFDTALGHTQEGLPQESVTIAEKLKEAGYATGCFGKWHLGYGPPQLPPSHGFDEFRGLASGDGDYHTHIDRQGNPDWWDGNELKPEEGYTTDLITNHSVDFIRQHQDDPFFLYVAHLGIHFPWQGPDDPPHRQEGIDYGKDKWGVIPDRSNIAPHVKAMIESVDDSTGRIVDELRKLGLMDNTLILFTSDNGGYLDYAGGFENISSNGPLRGQKTELFEGGHRVPMIISWPGKIEPGVTDALTHSTDLFPTFLAVSGTSDDEVRLDGVNLEPLLTHGEDLSSRTLYWRAKEARAARRGPWKFYSRGKVTSLYNLAEDIGETTDVSAEYPEILNELRTAWEQWEKDVNDSARQFEN